MSYRAIFRKIRQTSPRLAIFLIHVYSMLTGSKLLSLKAAIKGDVTEKAEPLSAGSIVALEDSKKRVSEFANASEKEHSSYAIVTILPPEGSGIATCSYYTFSGSNKNTILFSKFTDYEYYFSLNRRLDSKNNNVSIIDKFFFRDFLETKSGRHLLFVVGNSVHNIFVLDELNKVKDSCYKNPASVYIHDPCLLKLTQQYLKNKGISFSDRLKSLYPEKIDAIDKVPFDSVFEWDMFEALIKADIYGLRIIADMGINSFVVNSQTARKMVLKELSGSPFEDIEVIKLFHPVFLPNDYQPKAENVEKSKGDEIIIGSFGAPSKVKLTDALILAVKYLRDKKGYDISLVIAGFVVEDFVALLDIPDAHKFCTFVDSPSDTGLLKLMDSVDIAVQLRKKNLGESSGVIPQLLALGKKIMVSDIGAFSEYGDCVTATKADNADEIAIELEKMINTPRPVKAQQKYIENRSPKKFCSKLFKALDDVDSRD